MLLYRFRPALSFLSLYSHLLSMGAHLSSPKTDKVSCSGGDFSSHTTRYGSSSMQGWRVSMEDSHLAVPDLYQRCSSNGEKETDNGRETQVGNTAVASNKLDALGNINNSLVGVYGVFDGHGGSCVSQWVSENFASLLKGEIARLSELKNNQSIELKSLDAISETQAVLAESLQSAFLKVDEELQRAETEQALQKLNERPRSDNVNESFVDGSSLFKVLMPDRAPNRQQTIRLIEQHTERLLRESFNFHNSNQSDVHSTEDLTRYSEDDEDYQQKSPDDLDEDVNDEVYRHTSSEAHSVDISKEGASIRLNDLGPKTQDSKTIQDQMVTRTVNDDESMRSGDCLPDDEYEVETDAIGDGDGPSLAYGCGSTSVVVVVVGGETPAILVANAGDSRAVLSRGGQAVALSHDHKPQLREEGERIRRAGGSVTNGRVDGNLNLSRSLGDLAFKRDQSLPPAEQRISAMPDVRICPLTPQDEFIVLACDGIWDCKSNQQVVDFVRSRLFRDEGAINDAVDSDGVANNDPGTLAKICEELCDECLSSNPSESEGVGCDNMTVVIVQLSKHLVEKATTSAQPITLYGKQVDAYL
ncbi:protein phosphatase 2C, putative [Babesia bigemina]|uniref:protein-serine/threonine phosphatase n=1 Tax=Babesia bigemina TaxID=5866 RepID=A0A061D892_BABBI|nr:protein phosphatase 2C, putative [Babesia bigemina]CDR96202.1 protein phosphatase 2C, putative [Babesia bigemina]|eukprot:XP_012768388.1 protein phosphatase 2C, putative [Babesia bigemina]